MSQSTNTVGIVGGGQLARMSAQAAQRLGYRVAILDPNPNCPAAQVTPIHIQGDFDDLGALLALARGCDVVTFEHEWLDPEKIRKVEASGRAVYPSPATLSYLVDKFQQRRHFEEAGIPGPRALAIPRGQPAAEVGAQLGWPLVVKTRHGGYDGYGVRMVASAEEWRVSAPEYPDDWYAEERIRFTRELAVMVARGRLGDVAVYPVVESVQTPDGHRCDTVIAPAPNLPDPARREAAEMAVAAVEAVEGVGLFGIELFLVEERQVLLNEMAPRPHNSGHYTIDGSQTSQFEQHIRAVTGLPLGPTGLVSGACVMTNLLGSRNGAFSVEAATKRALNAKPQAHLHWYGKSDLRVGRKMGHINVVDAAASDALAAAYAAREAFWSEEKDGGE